MPKPGHKRFRVYVNGLFAAVVYAASQSEAEEAARAGLEVRPVLSR